MHQVILYTNRNIIVFDEEGKQVPELQEAVDCYGVDWVLLEKLLSLPAEYFISKWGEWKHPICKKEFEYLLGIRTLERDLDDFESGR